MSEYRPQVDTREHLKGMIQRSDPQSAEARIRELEEKAGHQHSQIYILDERIAKAREILQDVEPDSSCWLCMERKRNIQRALEALEEK